MAKHTLKLTQDEKDTSSMLEGYIPNDMLKDAPAELKGWVKSLLGVAARAINGQIGGAAGKLAIRYADSRNFSDEKKAQYGVWGERIARGALSTLPTRVKPAIDIGKDFFHNSKAVKQGFARALQAEGKGSSFFGLNSDLEVVRHQRDVNARATKLRTQGWLMGWLSALPSLALNEMEMVIENVERERDIEDCNSYIKEYKALRNPTAPEKRRHDNSVNKLKKLQKEKEQAGPILNERRENQAKRLLDRMGDTSWVPKGDGSGGLVEMLADADPTYKGNTDNMDEVDFLRYIKVRVGILYDTFATNWVNKVIGDRFTPKAKELLKKPTAGQMILGLEEFLQKNPSPVRVTIDKKTTTLQEYLYEIFVQHRENMGRKELRFDAKEQLHEACATIADAMTDRNRKLHPQALAFLIDGKYGIYDIQKGELKGVLTGDLLEDKIQALIDDRGLTTRKRMAKGQDSFSQAGFTREELAGSWGNLSPHEKLVWSTFLTNEMLTEIGLDKAEIRELRRQGNDACFEVMEALFHEMKKISQAELEEAGIDKRTIKRLNNFVEQLESNRRDSRNFLQENRDEAMELTARLGVKLDQQREGFISRIIEKGERKRNNEEEWREENREPKSFRDRVGARAHDSENEHEAPGASKYTERTRPRARTGEPSHEETSHVR